MKDNRPTEVGTPGFSFMGYLSGKESLSNGARETHCTRQFLITNDFV